jgi:3-deoxy-manno-octulosonate cytidylyltransferase (CMP-KDO synthetase)
MMLPDPSNTLTVIPARMTSTRLPGKPLALIGAEPMIVQVWRRAVAAEIGPVLVAAAEAVIVATIRAVGGEAVLTEPSLPSGSDRVAAALSLRDAERRFRFIVNLQGDLPTIEPQAIRACLAALNDPEADIATLAAEITEPDEAASTSVVKAIAPLGADRKVGVAEDFVRELGETHKPPHWHHIGIYAYRREALERFVALPPSAREKARNLEQLRALDAGMRIAVARVDRAPFGVDTPADLERARRLLEGSHTPFPAGTRR